MDVRDPVFSNLFQTLKGLRPGAVVAIDGRCGSGKSSLAAVIARELPCHVVHTDDFYLPPQCRSADWMNHPAGNMDLERLSAQVLVPLREKGEAQYCPFVCRTGEFGESRSLAAKALTIVEGSYSHHPSLAEEYDLKIFLTCTPEVQQARIRAREQDEVRFAHFCQIWIPLEERYFCTFAIPEHADLVMDTSTLF